MNLHILALFLLAKLASCEIEDTTSLTQRPGNDGPPAFYTFLQPLISRGWSPKFATGLNIIIGRDEFELEFSGL